MAAPAPRILFAICALGFSAAITAAEERATPLRIARVEASGPWPISFRDFERITDPLRGAPFDRERVQAAAYALKRELEKNLYPLAQVRWKAAPVPGRMELALRFEAEPGMRGRLVSMTIKGARRLSAKELESRLAHAAYRGFWDFSGRSVVRVNELGPDQERLLRAYHDRGYWDAKIGAPELIYDPHRRGYRLEWTILAEGFPYRTGILLIQGAPTNLYSSLRRAIGWKLGEVASADYLNGAYEKAKSFLYDHGYAFARVHREMSFDSDARTVQFRLLIDADVPVTFGSLRLEGVSHVNERVFRRVFELRRGDRFDPQKIARGAEELRGLGLFEDLDVSWTRGSLPGTFDLNIRGREAPSGSLIFGTFYNTDQGASIFGEVLERNLSLYPLGRGAANTGRFFAQFGERIRRVEASLITPRVAGTRTSIESEIGYEQDETVSDAFSTEKFYARGLAIRPLNRIWRISAGPEYADLRTRYEDVRLEQAAAELPTDVLLLPLYLEVSANASVPTVLLPVGVASRWFVRYASDVLISDLNWVNTKWTVSATVPIEPIFAVEWRIGYASSDGTGETGDLPLPLRLYMGGPETLRGFAFNSLGAKYDDGINLGAGSIWWSAIEWQQRLRSWVTTAIFYEIGDAAWEPWDFGGQGPVTAFGLGFLFSVRGAPIRMDVGWPLSVFEDDDENQIGQPRFSVSGQIQF